MLSAPLQLFYIPFAAGLLMPFFLSLLHKYLQRAKHYCKISGVGRVDIFIAYILRHFPDSGLKVFYCGLDVVPGVAFSYALIRCFRKHPWENFASTGIYTKLLSSSWQFNSEFNRIHTACFLCTLASYCAGASNCSSSIASCTSPILLLFSRCLILF